jgi:hypothetical protein
MSSAQIVPIVPYGTYVLQYKRGDSFQSVFQITAADGSTPETISGWSFLMTVDTLEDPPDASTKLFQVVGVVTDLALAYVGFAPTTANTDLKARRYFYDIQAIDGASRKRTIVKDHFEIIQDITKD